MINPSQSSYDVTSAQTLSQLYNGPNVAQYNQVNTVRQLEVTVIAEDNDAYNPSDLFSCAKLMGSQSGWQSVNNIALLDTTPGDETSLDMAAISMMSPRGTNLSYWGHWNEGGDWPEEWPSDILSSPSPWPLSLSVSWGGVDMYISEEQTGEQYLQLVALGGVTMFAASGDDGAEGVNNPDCDLGLGFDPSYPSSSPYVTAVGATQFSMKSLSFYLNTPVCGGTQTLQQLNSEFGFTGGSGYFACINQTSTETAVNYVQNSFISGGGFSQVYSQPSYQQLAVQRYLANTSIPFPNPSLYNPQNRGVPDIAIYGAGILVIIGGELAAAGGTSLSSPLAAALFAPLQDISLQYTGQGLGWLNPLLYQMWEDEPSLFNDITVGNNNGSRASPNCTLGGFTTAAGWDPVTGLGSPNIARMSQYLINLYTANSTSYSSSAPTINYINSVSSTFWSTGSTTPNPLSSTLNSDTTFTIGELLAVILGSIGVVGGLIILAYALRRQQPPPHSIKQRKTMHRS
jgi:subtilase family serine protease